MGLRPGMAKGPWVGTSGGGGGLSASDIFSAPSFQDDFNTSKPFWNPTQAVTSGDWSVNTGTGKLDGIAENNTKDWIRRGIEGDIDYQMKVERGGAGSIGFYIDGNGLTARISRVAAGTLFSCTGETSFTPPIGANTMWLRITWNATGAIKFYWKINDGDAWTLQFSYTGKNFGHNKIMSLDSANTGFIQRIILYDNMDVHQERALAPKVHRLTDAASIAVDASAGNFYSVTLGGNRQLGNPANPLSDGQMIMFRVTQDGTGSRTLSYDTKYRFSTDIPVPTLSTGAGDIDYIGFVYHESDDRWDCIAKVFGF